MRGAQSSVAVKSEFFRGLGVGEFEFREVGFDFFGGRPTHHVEAHHLVSALRWLASGPKVKDPGDTRIILVCRVSIANDGGAGGGKSISRGTESQVFRGRAAGKRMKTRSRRDKPNKIPQPCCFFCPARESSICLSPFFSDRCYSEDGNNSRTRGRMRCGKPEIRLRVARIVWG